MKRSIDAVWLLLVFLFLFLLLSSTAMYYAERGTWNASTQQWEREDKLRSPFQSIPEGFYWSMTTLTTVGYGDVTPHSGKHQYSMTATLAHCNLKDGENSLLH